MTDRAITRAALTLRGMGTVSQYHRFDFPNRLRLVVAEMPRMDSAAIGFWVGVGSRHEPPELGGISHFLEHLLFKGTARRSCQQLTSTIEGLGGALNGFTTEEMTCYTAKVLARHVPIALDVLADMVLHSRLAGPDIEKERRVILEEIRMAEDAPGQYVHEVVHELLWPAHPLGSPLAGTPATMARMVRGDLVRFKQRYYQPNHIVVAIAGAVDPAKAARRLQRLFVHRHPTPRARYRPVYHRAKPGRLRFVPKGTEQVHFCLGVHALPRHHRDRHALDLLSTVLGGNMSSRLFREVRERRGLAYDVGSYVKRYEDTGAFMISGGCEADRVVETLTVILRELERVRRRNITSREFQRAKEYVIGGLLMGLEETMDQMSWIGEHALMLNQIPHTKRIIDQLHRVEQSTLRRLAHRLIRPELVHAAFIGALPGRERTQLERVLRP